MTPVLVAVVVGVAAGFAAGGRLPPARRVRLRSWGLLVAGVGIEVVSHRLLAVLLAYALLAAFAARNLNRAGMGIVLVGIALNATPMLLDGGMPVEGHAIVSAGIAAPGDIPVLSFDGKRHLARAGDHLRALDDTIPEWWSHEVVSFGDLVIAVGVAAIVAGLLRQPTSVSHRSKAVAEAAGA